MAVLEKVNELTENESFIPARYRRLYYRVVTPLGALLAFYGLTQDVEWAVWVALLNAIVGGSGLLPIMNTPTPVVSQPVAEGEEEPPRLF